MAASSSPSPTAPSPSPATPIGMVTVAQPLRDHLSAPGRARRDRWSPTRRGAAARGPQRHLRRAHHQRRGESWPSSAASAGLPANGSMSAMLPDLSPRPGDLDPIETASRDEIAALQTRAPRADAAPRLRQRPALPPRVRRRRRASRRFPHARRPRRVPLHHQGRSARATIRSACSPCRASGSRASTPASRHDGQADRRRLHQGGPRYLGGGDGALDPRQRRPARHAHPCRLRLRPVHRRPRRALRGGAAGLRRDPDGRRP